MGSRLQAVLGAVAGGCVFFLALQSAHLWPRHLCLGHQGFAALQSAVLCLSRVQFWQRSFGIFSLSFRVIQRLVRGKIRVARRASVAEQPLTLPKQTACICSQSVSPEQQSVKALAASSLVFTCPLHCSAHFAFKKASVGGPVVSDVYFIFRESLRVLKNCLIFDALVALKSETYILS